MAKIKREQPNYLAVGVFFLLGVVSIMVGVIFADKLIYKLKGGYPIYVRFNQLDGLSVGSRVIVGAGKDVGSIESIAIDGSQLIVKAIIDKNFKINATASFQIFSTSLVGGKYLAVENYTGESPLIKAGAELRGVDPFSFNTIFSKISDMFSPDSEIGDGIGSIFSSISGSVDQVNGLLSDNKTNFNTIITNVVVTTENLKEISINLNRKLNKISDREFQQLVSDLSLSISNLNIFLEDINSPNAPLTVLKDPKMNHSIRTIITNLEETTKRVKAKPSLLLR